ncbi:hypothetical protein GUITHDRAFT_149150 [Guillardia theta CCMP2712]|uniref:Uncharacterized protein n=1 Tax=Guillardia theta (strain CCMP2712) TaxID=905079 RepID=L1I727_GUITC|nr:hypothetical protein GUITHDRAFT_149150 [Guillardia theta CCMP2712]EKX31670.1 hypothetical protein GUITHDRAFT_149150 [Guillardia theta CCMP2712]|eukprot:XP_005818650.1 hypothetical protein GUITHDRAFT_149150 [Guillardia theta CCMP2712]
MERLVKLHEFERMRRPVVCLRRLCGCGCRGGCALAQTLRRIALETGLLIRFEKVLSGQDLDPGDVVMDAATSCSVMDAEGCHLVWVNYVKLEPNGFPSTASRRSWLCFGDLLRGRVSLDDAEVQKYRRFFKRCASVFTEKFGDGGDMGAVLKYFLGSE